MAKKILSLIIFLLVLLAGILLFNTLNFKSKQVQYPPLPREEVSDSAVDHLIQAIRIPTVSRQEGDTANIMDFRAFSDFLTRTYPTDTGLLTHETINQFSHLYKWQGSDPSLAPVLLAAHLDVVPADSSTAGPWKFQPFSGHIAQGALWGRGTLDDKVGVIGIMEAVSTLLRAGYKPQRTFYFAFGHDEEIGGKNGAKSIAKHLKEKGVKPAFVLDEGYAVTRGLVPGVLTDVALIGIAEKGFCSIELMANIEGGHSSMPGRQNAIGAIAAATSKLQANPFESKITTPVALFLKYVGPEMRFREKLAFANTWLFEPMIINTYEKTNLGRAIVQTTIAPTIFRSGIKDNVIPEEAEAVVNFRILPGSTVADVVRYVRMTIDNPKIHLKVLPFKSEPSAVSAIDTQEYRLIDKTIKEVFPEVITAPNLFLAATDGRYYTDLCKDVYRFLPTRLGPWNINTIHGRNERITIENFKEAIRFYMQLIKNSATEVKKK